jgi:cell division septum initiation protein DivIVA
MSMWKRLSRAVSSNMERFRDDPLGTIKRDIANFNADLATVREQVRRLEADLARLTTEDQTLGDMIAAALKAGDRDRGLDLAGRLSEVRRDKARVERQLETTRQVVRKAEGVERTLDSERATRVPAPAIKVRARETLERLERELEAEPSSSADKTLGSDASPAPSEVPAAERPTATKTFGAASVEPDAPEPQSPGEAIGTPVGGTPESDLVDELERLAQLKESGALSEEEFGAAKKKLIDP